MGDGIETPFDYTSSCVNIEAGEEFVKSVKETVIDTYRKEVFGNYGGFNGMTRIPKNYINPVLVQSTDGVGTKLDMALHDSHLVPKHYNMFNIGIDLVAMCVNCLLYTSDAADE